MAATGMKRENIRVAVRVRPLLPQEAHRDEVIYYPNFEEGPLSVSDFDNHPLIQSIKVADGQHMIESKYDMVFK